ncbi:hypothetical protein BGX38DRAFT_1333838 [Terfezia claveryi]|nr:hypothetical protein BGX38DRAFT_1333838 [Terfezia claveryi]
MPQIHKGKGKDSARPLAVPNLDNRPRYETPDLMQLATLGPIPRVQLHTTGVQNSENEERLDGWEEEQGTEKFKRIGKREEIFLLQYTMCFLKDTFFDTELSVVETILGGVERRTGLPKHLIQPVRSGRGKFEEERIIGGLKDEILCLSKERDVLDTELSHLKQTLVAFADQRVAHVETIERLEKEIFKLKWEKEKWVEREEIVGNQLQIYERNWKEWAEEEMGKRSKKILSDHIEKEVVKVQAEVGVQTEMGVEKEGAGDSDNIMMVDGSSMYAYEDEDEAPVAVAPVITKKQAALCLAAKAGKKSRPAKTPPQNTPPSENIWEKAIMIHGVPC